MRAGDRALVIDVRFTSHGAFEDIFRNAILGKVLQGMGEAVIVVRHISGYSVSYLPQIVLALQILQLGFPYLVGRRGFRGHLCLLDCEVEGNTHYYKECQK